MIPLRNRLALMMMASLGWLAGCGTSPTATGEAPPAEAPRERILLSFSPQAAQRAAKVASSELQGTQTRTIGPTGGKLRIGELEDDEKALGALFAVPPGAVNTPVDITMSLYGRHLSDLVVEFAPCGLVFNIPAILSIRIGEDRVDVPIEQLVVLHQHKDGSTEQASFVVKKEEESYLITVQVPGFSFYSLGDGVGLTGSSGSTSY